jgi:hypothetical protein
VFFLLFIVNAVVFLFIMLFKVLGHLSIDKPPVQPESDTEQILNNVELLTDEEKSFNKQTKCYYWITFALTVVGLAVGIVGVFVIEKVQLLGCGQNGAKWLYLKNLGNLFELFHILIAIF